MVKIGAELLKLSQK